ncbi:MAG: C-terminal binding protein [Armatimonadetes bacterium]|nr:C-terminal binding protein [Armatimonadota bacterium]
MCQVVITDAGYASYNLEKGVVESIGGALEIRQCVTEDDVIALAKGADGIIVRLQPITSRVIDALERCRVIARYGTGVDNVDVAAATARGIVVANVVNFGVHEVAEHAIALLFSCIRKTVSHDKRIRAGEWDIAQRDPIARIQGKTLGLVGIGAIGRQVVSKLRGFELRVVAYDPYATPEAARELGVELADLDTLLSRSDYVTVHAPLTPETRHIIGRETLAKMKPSAILVNTSRGGLVDTEALYEALKNGKINSAGLDVHETEPPPAHYPVYELDNVVVSDHAAWYSEESIRTLQRSAAVAVAAVLSGGWPVSVVNPEVREVISGSARR